MVMQTGLLICSLTNITQQVGNFRQNTTSWFSMKFTRGSLVLYKIVTTVSSCADGVLHTKIRIQSDISGWNTVPINLRFADWYLHGEQSCNSTLPPARIPLETQLIEAWWDVSASYTTQLYDRHLHVWFEDHTKNSLVEKQGGHVVLSIQLQILILNMTMPKN